MTTPIRPGFPSAPTPPQRSAAVSEAQRAFFQAALQGAQPAAAAVARPATAPVIQTTPVQASAPARPNADQPAERLGRHLDIRV